MGNHNKRELAMSSHVPIGAHGRSGPLVVQHVEEDNEIVNVNANFPMEQFDPTLNVEVNRQMKVEHVTRM